jgi:hypothetical protein
MLFRAVTRAKRALLPAWSSFPGRRNAVPSLCLTLIQLYGQRRHQDPWRREDGQGEGGTVADGGEAGGRQDREHFAVDRPVW